MITIPKEKDILFQVALNTINLTMFSRCWVQILRNVSPLFMNQIICLSNLLSGRLPQKRACALKWILTLLISIWTTHPSDGTGMWVYCMENITHILHVKKTTCCSY